MSWGSGWRGLAPGLSPVLAPVLALGLAVAPVAAVAQVATPATRMAAYNDGVVAIMKAGVPVTERVTRFEALVTRHYDMAGIAGLVVGPRWATAPAGERAAVVAALTHHSAVSLARNFKSFGGERFVVDPVVASRGPSSIVKVTIASKGRSDVLQYRMRQAGGEWRIVDVVAQGVSQLALQRAELAGTVARDGVGGLAKVLAARDAELIKR